MYRILFVCLGNICRSPLAEGLMAHKLRQLELTEAVGVDSAGTGDWHTGEEADPRSQEVARRHGFWLTSRARQVQISDFYQFELILAMDHQNFQVLRNLRPEDARAELRLMRDYDPQPDDGVVPDPYFGGGDGFEKVYRILDRSLDRLLETLPQK
jgi:protein-tyrosine phosphatase